MSQIHPLRGVVVLDLARLLPGEAAAQMLEWFGAKVIPIQLPEYDLKTAAGRDALLELVDGADVLMESFRPGVMQRFGLDFETLRRRNGRLIYAAITGYGQDGPYASLAGHDINYLAMAGVLDITGEKDGPPAIVGVQIADLAGGAMQAVIGILLALEARRQSGRGLMVDASMLRGALWTMEMPLRLRAAGKPTGRGDALLSGRYACYRVYQTAGGRWLAVGALEAKFWANLCRALECEPFIPDQFVEGARQREIIDRLSAIFLTRTAGAWCEYLMSRDTCVTPVRNIQEVVAEFGETTPSIPVLTE